jgi:hypothetical protein
MCTASIVRMNSANKTSVVSKPSKAMYFCWNSCRKTKCG